MKNPKRSEVEQEFTWDLTPLYVTAKAWREEFEAVEKQLPSLDAFRGKLGESEATLLHAIESYLGIARNVERLYAYAHMKSDEDTSNTENLGRLDQITNLYTRFAAQASFIDPELLAIPEATLTRFLAAPRLLPYARYITEIVRYRAHTLTTAEEELLAKGGEVFESAAHIYSQLKNADMKFGTLPLNGSEVELTHGSYILFLRDADPETRRRAYERYNGKFLELQFTIASALAASAKKNVYVSSVRRYPTARDAALFPDDVPGSVYDNLIEVISDGLPSLHRYYELRKKVLGLSEQRLSDVYAPLVSDVRLRHEYSEAAELVIEALEPLGKEYTEVMRRGLLKDRWVDVHENIGKRSGAYSSEAYGGPCYILLNYKEEELDQVFTLAHEAGHAMHSYFSNSTQPYQDAKYSIFVAEVASEFNEQLLAFRLARKFADQPEVRRYLINHQLDAIKATLFRQTMFAEFEKQVHNLVEQNEPLTTDTFKTLYLALLKKYFGPSVLIEENDWIECLRIPHFYSAFYVYKYATGIAAAISLADSVMNGEKGAVARYLTFLKAGRSGYPLEVLRAAGADMSKPDPIRRAVQTFDRLLTEFEALSA
ncbi:MAG: oligoendopeptidase F [Deltaproteobacteria bacterium]|nr:oligoendopeptidase F [Deltaproteobacteria bacterium]